MPNIQRGTISVAANAVCGYATISAVTTAKATVRNLGISGLQQVYDMHCRLELTTTTNVQATFTTGQPTGNTATVGFEVAEF